MTRGASDDVDLARQAFEAGDIDGALRQIEQFDQVYGSMRSNSQLFPGLQPAWEARRRLLQDIEDARSGCELGSSREYEINGAATA
jgi:hypothetical protein